MVNEWPGDTASFLNTIWIGLGKVVVDYDFRNDTDQDVITEVAFSVPPYDSGMDWSSFSDFKLEIDGKPASFQVEAKGFGATFFSWDQMHASWDSLYLPIAFRRQDPTCTLIPARRKTL